MLIDLTCPAEVFEAVLPTEDSPAVSLALYNLSDRVIASVEVTLKLLSHSGSEKERVVYRARALNGRPYSTFPMHVPCSPCPAAVRADVTVDKVWFSDNAVWRREQSASVEYTPNNLPVSKALADLKYVAGENAVGFPCVQGGLWICVCGRPNPEKEAYCARCRRQRETIFARYNREAVEKQISQRERQLDLSTRSVREDTARLQRIREEEYNLKQRRKAQRRRTAACLPLLLALLAALHFGIVPALRLYSADRAMGQGNYTAAARTLESLGTFPGAPERLSECRWQAAKAMAESAADAASLRAASEALRALEGRPESIAMAEEADLVRAQLAVEAGDPAAARSALELLPEEDPRRSSIENSCLLLEAESLMAQGKYAAARETFLAVADVFPEAANKAAECVFIPATALILQGKYDEAIREMNRIPDYPGSRAAVQECHYRKAEAAEAAGDLETAAAEYMLADDYADARDRTNRTVFTMAENAYAAGDTAGAQKLFASLPGYAPAEARNNECLLELAKAASAAGRYGEAMAFLGALPEGYEGAAGLLPRTAYLAGAAAMKNHEYEQAVQYYEAAGEYRDAPSKLSGALDALIRFKLDAGNGTDALALLPRAEGSRNYDKYRQEAEYLDAVARAEAGESPAALLGVFESLGNYMDAAAWARRMCSTLAQEAEARGETLEAARLYERAGDTGQHIAGAGRGHPRVSGGVAPDLDGAIVSPRGTPGHQGARPLQKGDAAVTAHQCGNHVLPAHGRIHGFFSEKAFGLAHMGRQNQFAAESPGKLSQFIICCQDVQPVSIQHHRPFVGQQHRLQHSACVGAVSHARAEGDGIVLPFSPLSDEAVLGLRPVHTDHLRDKGLHHGVIPLGSTKVNQPGSAAHGRP